MMFWEKFLGLCSLKGLKPNRVAAELGISSGSVTKWKNGSVPSTENMRRLAAFFGVTVDWLTGNSQFRTQQELNRCLECRSAQGLRDWNALSG
jgi:transcriptional regulator with XRE-family HTH domain